jgi:NAD(P)-dependent dehydrogenase (short-subunit alcohol dehydrogenase family)
VTVVDVDEEMGSKVANEIDGTFIKVDVTDHKQVQAAMAQVVQERGSLDGVVVNAGVVGKQMHLADYDLDEWKRVIDVNLSGAFYTLKYALAQMIKQETGGSIVSLSSTAAFRGLNNLGPYTASKWAIRGLTEMAAVEYAQKNIRVNAIAPTSCETPMVKTFIAHSADSEGMKDAVTANYALPGFVQPMDVANAAAFLLSDEARYITGHTLPVDAGSLCRMANARDHTNVK